MGKPFPIDLRVEALAAVDAGVSRRAAADRLGVSAASVIRWDLARRERGDLAPKPQGGDQRSNRIETQADFILSLVEARGDITLEEIRAALSTRGVDVAVSTIWRFFERRGLTRQKAHARRAGAAS